MSIKFNRKTWNLFSFYIITSFPLVNLAIAFINNGKGLLTLYVFYSLFIIFWYLVRIHCAHAHVSRKVCFVFLLLILEFVIAWLVSQGGSLIKEYLPFVFCIFYWLCYDTDELVSDIILLMQRKTVFVFGVQLIYYFVLFLSVNFGNGIDRERWGIISLKGPYGINHLLAYELLVFCIIDASIWIESRAKFAVVLFAINVILMLLTGVRGVLVPLAIAMAIVYMRQPIDKKIALLIVAVAGIVYLYQYTNVLKPLIEKSINAAQMGSMSNGRGSIFLSSLKAYIQSNNIFNYIGGIGLYQLEKYNYQNIRMAIHAHNDYIDALAQYGVIGFTVYMAAFENYIRTLKRFARAVAMALVMSLAFFNGFYMYQSVAIMSPYFLVFAKCVVEHGHNRWNCIEKIKLHVHDNILV